jgi:hypothetical protein
VPFAAFAALGAGWGLLGGAFIVVGTLRQRRGHRAIQAGSFVHLDQRATMVLAGYMLLLTVATVVALFWSD